MAGHSKWANIKHRKERADQKRGKMWSKISRAIITAAKAGGGDPASNLTLRYAIIEARAANMPKDTIERAIKKGSGGGEGEDYAEIRYEGYGPAGVAVMVDTLTDNRSRTAPDLRHIFSKHGGNLGENGCVSFMFEQKGVIVIEADRIEEDTLMELSLDAGAQDVEQQGDAWVVTTSPTDYLSVRDALEAAGIEPVSSELTMDPTNVVSLASEDADKIQRLVDALEDNDDVQKVYTNHELADAAV